MKDGIYADILTSRGSILIELFYQKAPGTVANFIGLVNGQIKNDFKPLGTPFYDNLKFHRVISDFMIQSGCPLGSGSGGPGYKFEDEFHEDLKHDKPGVLSNITNRFAKFKISVKRIIQTPDKKTKKATIVIITHKTTEINAKNCLSVFKKNKDILKFPTLIRLYN